ncbi:MAG: YcnI family protein [Actinobacteria bacterium]|nr:YcnI family protein [Actinomycetota bacterium]
MKKRAVLAAALTTMAVPAGAQAHVSFHPNDVPAGANVTFNIRVPNEETNADTTKVDVAVPPGFLDVATQPIPGWNAKVLTRKLAKPVQTDQGKVTEEVSEIIWSGGKIPPGGFQNFAIATAMPDDATGTLTFKTLQTYSNGKVVRWIGPPSANEPAPTIAVAPKGGAIIDVAGDEAGPGDAAAKVNKLLAANPTSAKSSTKGASKGLGIAALVVAIVGLLIGLAALMRPRSRGAAG